MAAEAYSRIDNRLAALCVTTGPGATNAITGVVGGWMDSIPMLVLSGQARYATTVYASGLRLRTRGVQEFDIIEAVRSMTKYAELVHDPMHIRYALEKAVFLAKAGRPGPCWLDIPLDVQAAVIETEQLESYRPKVPKCENLVPVVHRILAHIRAAKRPVLFCGNGVRLAGAHEAFLRLVDALQVPVVTGMSSVDAIASDHPLYAGRSGGTGDRAGNFAMQNADLLLSLGSRLSFFQTGFAHESWARGAYKILNDIDAEELRKDSLHADETVCADAKQLIDAFLEELPAPLPMKTDWVQQCQKWRKTYPVVTPAMRTQEKPSIYYFYDQLTHRLGAEDCLVASVGTSRVAGSQASFITEGMRFLTNPSTAAMGYDLPAAIGACVARGGRRTVLVTGEGSLQMNLQELQTIVHHSWPIVIFVMNNEGYHSIRMTQRKFFHEPLIGVGPESLDLSFPDLSKLVPAYGMCYRRCGETEELAATIEWALKQKTPVLTEIFIGKDYCIAPKAASKMLSNGQMVSAPLEDQAPFLSEDELRQNMYVPMIE